LFKDSISTNMTTKCSKCINVFCFVCGQFTPKNAARIISPQMSNGYNLYFGIDAKEEMNKSWGPNVIYATCTRYLRAWLNGKIKSTPYAVPMIFRKQTNHVTDCYLCQTNLTRQKIWYTNVKSVTKPVPHTKDMFPPICPPNVGEEVVSTMSPNHTERTTCDEFQPEDDEPHLLNKND